MVPTDWLWIIGTGAELIKCAPVIGWLHQNNHQVRVLCTGQHSIEHHVCWSWLQLPSSQRHHLPPLTWRAGQLAGLLAWFGRQGLRTRQQLVELLQPSLGTVVMVHGDTLSTVLGAYWARQLGLPIVHLEAGLRSFSRLRPFPEEWSRQWVGCVADVALCGSEFAATNQRHQLLGLGLGKPDQMVVMIPGNTLQDSVRAAQIGEFHQAGHGSALDLPWLPQQPYILWTLHRQELLWSRGQLTAIVHALLAAAKTHGVLLVGVIHPQTRKRLQAFQLWHLLEQAEGLMLLPVQPFPQFIYLLQHALGLLSDGGSNQEEASYLGCPHLVLRSETERLEGLGRTARLWRGVEDIPVFIRQILKEPMRAQRLIDPGPSAAIGQWLVDWRTTLGRSSVSALPHGATMDHSTQRHTP